MRRHRKMTCTSAPTSGCTMRSQSNATWRSLKRISPRPDSSCEAQTARPGSVAVPAMKKRSGRTRQSSINPPRTAPARPIDPGPGVAAGRGNTRTGNVRADRTKAVHAAGTAIFRDTRAAALFSTKQKRRSTHQLPPHRSALSYVPIDPAPQEHVVVLRRQSQARAHASQVFRGQHVSRLEILRDVNRAPKDERLLLRIDRAVAHLPQRLPRPLGLDDQGPHFFGLDGEGAIHAAVGAT